MLLTNHHIELTAAEIANIWSNYMSDTAAICILNAFLSHVEDKENRSIIEFVLQFYLRRINKNYNHFLTKNKFPSRMGFH